MPDGDVYHKSIGRPFRNTYGKWCEGHWSEAELGYMTLHPLKKQLQNYGNVPIQMANKIVSVFQDACKEGSLNEHTLPSVVDAIDQIVRNPDMNGSPRGRDIMCDAAMSLASQVFNQANSNLMEVDVSQKLFEGYVDRVYKKDYEDRLHDTERHYKDASHQMIDEMKVTVRPYVNRGVHEYATQLRKSGKVEKLRRSNKLKLPDLNHDDDAW